MRSVTAVCASLTAFSARTRFSLTAFSAFVRFCLTGCLLDLVATLLQVALDTVARAADAGRGLATGLAATTLELVDLARDLSPEALDLTLAARGLREGLDRLGDGECGADGDVNGTLGRLADVGDSGLGDVRWFCARVSAAFLAAALRCAFVVVVLVVVLVLAGCHL